MSNQDYTYDAKLIRVIDGDTIDVSIDLGFDISINTRVRLLGVDAPETRTRDLDEKKRGMEAKKFVQEMFKKNGNKCLVHSYKNTREKYGRYLARVLFGDICLNDLLLENNHAVPFP
jgi:micrococcal nuclease